MYSLPPKPGIVVTWRRPPKPYGKLASIALFLLVICEIVLVGLVVGVVWFLLNLPK